MDPLHPALFLFRVTNYTYGLEGQYGVQGLALWMISVIAR